MECPRGWILTVNDQGFMVPFFVKTRSVDVFYSSSVSSKFGDAGVISNVDSDTIMVLPPGQSYLYQDGIWDIQLNNDESFRIGTSITLKATDLIFGPDSKYLRLNVAFPFPILTKHLIDVQITKECSGLPIITSHLNVVFDEESEAGDVSGMQVHIYQHDGSAFDGASLTNPEIVEGNTLHISISGIAQLGEYSHMDDGNQIGAEWDGSSSGIGAKDVYTKSETDALVAALRSDVEEGKVLTPPNIIDVADDPEDSDVLPTGIVIDIEEPTDGGVETTTYVSEDKEINEKLNDPNVVSIDIDDITI